MTRNSSSLFVVDVRQAEEESAYVGLLMDDEGENEELLLALRDLGEDFFNRLVSCNPENEIFPVKKE